MTAIQERAEEARSHFEQIKRGDDQIWSVKDSAPQWVTDLAHHAHGDMMPDDWRYQFIVDALDILAEEENPDNYVIALDADVDVYTGELLAWLGSRLDRTSYVNEALEECGRDAIAPEEPNIVKDIMAGQYKEREEVLYLVRDFLAEMG